MKMFAQSLIIARLDIAGEGKSQQRADCQDLEQEKSKDITEIANIERYESMQLMKTRRRKGGLRYLRRQKVIRYVFN